MATAFVGSRARDLGVAAGGGAALLSPLGVLEALNRTDRERLIDAFVLFSILWLLAVGFLMILLFLVRNERRDAMRLLLAISCAVAIAFVWGSIVVDQWPCFLGTPNCD